MEPRPIDGNALYDMIQDNACHDVMSVADVLNFIEDAPALDYAPVKHGEWIHDINNLYGCSECLGRETMSHKALKKYCPNCGARMEA